jgi:hypothetical protein
MLSGGKPLSLVTAFAASRTSGEIAYAFRRVHSPCVPQHPQADVAIGRGLGSDIK